MPSWKSIYIIYGICCVRRAFRVWNYNNDIIRISYKIYFSVNIINWLFSFFPVLNSLLIKCVQAMRQQYVYGSIFGKQTTATVSVLPVSLDNVTLRAHSFLAFLWNRPISDRVCKIFTIRTTTGYKISMFSRMHDLRITYISIRLRNVFASHYTLYNLPI